MIEHEKICQLETELKPAFDKWSLTRQTDSLLPRIHYRDDQNRRFAIFFDVWISKLECRWNDDRVEIPEDPTLFAGMGARCGKEKAGIVFSLFAEPEGIVLSKALTQWEKLATSLDMMMHLFTKTTILSGLRSGQVEEVNLSRLFV